MTNEEQLREEHNDMWKEYQIQGFSTTGRNSVCDWWLAKLHQEELNWVTEQIERVELTKTFTGGSSVEPKDMRVVKLDVLAPIIERKKELEDIIRNESNHDA